MGICAKLPLLVIRFCDFAISSQVQTLLPLKSSPDSQSEGRMRKNETGYLLRDSDRTVGLAASQSWSLPYLTQLGHGEGQIISDPLLVRRTLTELASMGRDMAMHRHNGEYLGICTIEVDAGMAVYLRFRPVGDIHDFLADGSVNVTTSTEHGLVLFSLSGLAQLDFDLLRARWPQELVCIHTRRHDRLICSPGSGLRVALSLPQSWGHIQVMDLSEDGISFEFESPSWPTSEVLVNGGLSVEDHFLRVPWFQIVHMKKTPGRLAWHLGARMLGLSADDRSALKRWLEQTQAVAGASTRSNL